MGQLSGMSCTRQATGFLGNFEGFPGGELWALFANKGPDIFLQQRWQFSDSLCTFQTIYSDSAEVRNSQARSATANLGQYSSILCESWSQLSTFRHCSDNISPSGLFWADSWSV